MALPPKGDPQRPVQIVVRIFDFLGVLFIAAIAIPFAITLWEAGHVDQPNTENWWVIWFVVCALPAFVLTACNFFIRRSHRWAIIATMAILSVILVVCYNYLFRWMLRSHSTILVYDLAFILIGALLVILGRAFASLQVNCSIEVRGFPVEIIGTVVQAQPVIPLAEKAIASSMDERMLILVSTAGTMLALGIYGMVSGIWSLFNIYRFLDFFVSALRQRLDLNLLLFALSMLVTWITSPIYILASIFLVQGKFRARKPAIFTLILNGINVISMSIYYIYKSISMHEASPAYFILPAILLLVIGWLIYSLQRLDRNQ